MTIEEGQWMIKLIKKTAKMSLHSLDRQEGDLAQKGQVIFQNLKSNFHPIKIQEKDYILKTPTILSKWLPKPCLQSQSMILKRGKQQPLLLTRKNLLNNIQ
jgi:hypothetical protein